MLLGFAGRFLLFALYCRMHHIFYFTITASSSATKYKFNVENSLSSRKSRVICNRNVPSTSGSRREAPSELFLPCLEASRVQQRNMEPYARRKSVKT